MADSVVKVWIVLPCFFDTAAFLRVREEAMETLERAVPRVDVTFALIDDTAGLDPAVAELAALGNVRVVTPPYNLGHQGALVFALRSMGNRVEETDYVVTMDCDGEDRPGDLGELLAPLLREPESLHRVSLALRTRRQESAMFKVLYTGFKLVFRSLTGTVIRSGNFVAYRGWLLKEVIFHPHFDHCYSSSFVSLPIHGETVPLPRGVRYAGKSSMGYMGLVRHGIRMLMPFSEQIATRGMIASALGMTASLVALVALWARGLPVFLPAFGLLYATLTMGICVLWFATFSQSKARSLRGLQEPSRPPRAPPGAG